MPFSEAGIGHSLGDARSSMEIQPAGGTMKENTVFVGELLNWFMLMLI